MGTEKRQNVPKLRVEGFADAWEDHQLGDLGYCKSGVGFPENEQGGENGIPFFKVSDMNLEGNEDELLSANNYVSVEQIEKRGWNPIEETSIMFAKVGAAIYQNRKRLVQQSFLLDNNTMAYIPGPCWDIHFCKVLFDRMDLTQLVQIGALPSYNAKDVEAITIPIPKDITEQKSIGDCMSRLSSLIILHQRKLSKLQDLKKALLVKMFPAESENVPAVRFKGYEDAWEQHKLGDVATEFIAGGDIDVKKIKEEGLYPVCANALTENGIVGYYSDRYRVIGPAVTITGRGDVGHAVARKYNFTPVVRLISVKSNVDVDFLSEAINKSKITVESTGVPQLTIPQASNIVIFLSSSDKECAIIGNLFQKIDTLITLHQRKLNKLKDIKKALLNNMFPGGDI